MWLLRSLLALLGISITSVCIAASSPVVITVADEVLRAFRQSVNVDQIDEINDYEFLQGKPDVVELVMLIQALHLGGLTETLSIKAVPSTDDVLETVLNGTATLAGSVFWRSRVQPLSNELWVSDATIRQGEYSLGVYSCGKPLEPQRLLHHLASYVAVLGNNDAISLRTLRSIGVQRLLIMENWTEVVTALCNNEADFTFAPFPVTETLVLNESGHTLRPTMGIKVSVPGSQHFIVTKTGRGRSAYFMLQRGLRKMRLNGQITQAYEQSGKVSGRAERWQLLNP